MKKEIYYLIIKYIKVSVLKCFRQRAVISSFIFEISKNKNFHVHFKELTGQTDDSSIQKLSIAHLLSYW